MKLAHASDLHLLSLRGSTWLDFANKRWIGGLNLLTNRGRHYRTEIFESMIDDLNQSDVDHILITGDVTNLALDEEFRFAKRLFDRLKLGPDNITVIPGNHDTYIEEGAEHFARHFGSYSKGDPEFDWEDGEPWPMVRVRQGVAIVGLSTSLKTPWFTAYGKLGSKQLGRLDALLADERLKNCFRVVAIHHSPAGKPSESRVRGLRDRKAFAEVVARRGCELILHGHEHRDLSHSLPGPDSMVSVRGIPSGTYDAGPNSGAKLARYRVYDLGETSEAHPGLSEALRYWNPKTTRFSGDAA